MRIRENVRLFIKKDAMASIGSDGLMGNMLVNISAGDANSPPVRHDDFLQSYSRIKTDDILKTLNLTNENAAMLTSNLLEVTQQIKYGKGTLTYLLYDSMMRKELSQSILNLRKATQQTNALLAQTQAVMEEMSTGDGTLSWLLNDTTLVPQVTDTFSDLRKTSAKINLAADSLQVFMTHLNQDRGLIHTLLTDTAAVTDFKQTLHNINQSSVKLNQNMEAMKHNFLFRGYFRRQENKNK
jgi:phospholipid/cholesterol/gamma-HCH transport system substrate-binding protein